MNDILQRAKDMAKSLAQQYLNAAVYRVVWAMPVGIVIVIGVVLFVLLAVFG